MSEQRLICANAVEAEIRKLAEKHFANGDIEFSNGVMKSVTRVKSAPTIEPPAVRGEWTRRMMLADVQCSVCGKMQFDETAFCPNCGADMRCTL